MKIEQVMTKNVFSCYLDDSLNAAVQIMWEHDCGCVPVVDYLSRVVGIVTDRDACMAAYTQGRPLAEILVSEICTRNVEGCRLGESVSVAEQKMAKAQVRRLVVTDAEDHLVGIVSLSDLAHLMLSTHDKVSGLGARSISTVLEAVSRARPHTPEIKNNGTRAHH
ncbi:MAG: hypothetical protein RL701_4169 [Pseudomonadota bacterium]|jgi:CBS domain-containing protein